MRKSKLFCLTLICAGLGSLNVSAQEKFPSRPIEMIVNFGTGGGADQLGRIAAKLLEPVLDVAVPVSNVAGASGNTGLAKVASAQPDGYTIGTITGISISSWAAGMGRLIVNDFAYLGVVQSSPSMLFVAVDSPFKNYQQLLEHAKANPNKLKVATSGYGTPDDFAVKFLATKGYTMVNAPYAKPGERYTSVLGKHADVLYEEPGDVAQFLSAKQIRPIIVFGASRHPEFPDVPASAEFGHNIDQPNWRAIVTSAKVPAERLAILNAALSKIIGTDDWKKFCAQTYTCIPAMNPADSKKFVQKNFDDMVKYLKESGTKTR
jgi:putative tricarboxylic transport membrane protein